MDRRWNSMVVDVSDLRSHLTTPYLQSSTTLDLSISVPSPTFQPFPFHSGTSSSTPLPFPTSSTPPPDSYKPPKIHLPLLDGSNLLDWIFSQNSTSSSIASHSNNASLSFLSICKAMPYVGFNGYRSITY